MHQTRTRLIAASMAALLMLTACGGGGGSSTPTPNTAPTANAGATQTVVSGAAVTLSGAASSDADGSIAGYAWTQTAGTAVTLSNASGAQTGFTAPQVVSAVTLTFSLVVTDNRGAASAAATVSITVNPAAPMVNVIGLVRFARVPFLNVFPFGLNYANATMQPARGVIVRALDAANPANVLATGATTASGNYNLTVASNVSMTIQVVARMQSNSSQSLPGWDVRVQDGALTTVAPYAFTSAAFNSNVGAQNIDIPTGIAANGTATGVRASGPFAILDTIYTAIQTVVGVAPAANFPALVVDWGSQTSGTQFTTQTAQHIALLADLTEDTDEFDQHVIAHEFGHFLEHNFSRADNIGGPHAAGDRLDMRVAFGEGWGYAFAAIALNDTTSLDSFVDNGVQRAGGFDVESNPATNPPATTAGLGCWCNESSVWSILWDLYDNNPDANDGVFLAFQPIWDVLTSTQKNTPAVTSIFSFIAALKTAQPASAAAINTLVAAQNINAAGIDAFATAETNTPFPNLLPLFPTVTLGVPVVVHNLGNIGTSSLPERLYNKAGNHNLLRFTAPATRTFNVSLSTSNAAAEHDPDFVVYRSGTQVSFDGENDFHQFPETGTFSGTLGTTYIIDAYDCANGCPLLADGTPQGTPGAYDLTVTIN